jgi:hypothetical protein
VAERKTLSDRVSVVETKIAFMAVMEKNLINHMNEVVKPIREQVEMIQKKLDDGITSRIADHASYIGSLREQEKERARFKFQMKKYFYIFMMTTVGGILLSAAWFFISNFKLVTDWFNK